MKIDAIEISVFELPIHPESIELVGVETSSGYQWQRGSASRGLIPVQVMRVRTDAGIDGVCTVGDWRYTEMQPRQLNQLRTLAVGENPLERERLYLKLTAATRPTFADPGWFGGFDNCLWDIVGKASALPVAQLLGGAKQRCQAYFNITGRTAEDLIRSGQEALRKGYTALKDHLPFSPQENERIFRLIRESVGENVALMHDAALVDYTYEEALHIGRVLEALEFVWLEEPLSDRRYEDYIRLTERLDIPVAGAETLMNEPELSALWLKSGAVDILRVNGRHGTTPVLKLAHFAEMQHKKVEPNSLGPLFGLVHAHLCCGIHNIGWFEMAPPHNGKQLAEEIGLLNPVVPHRGWVTYPNESPGWGAQWDWGQFEKKRIAEL